MKKEKAILPVPKDKKMGIGNNPEHKIKKGKSAVSTDNTITSAVKKTIARTGSGLANEGTLVSYEEER
ncbi:MAG: hypothetical protein V4539_15985 [Bacteroidota bacterium]